ncbi:cyclic nucleotide-binding domain-containing protein [Desulfoprunum benzoelyticum]|uniref:CRP-like cAMP-binding protein n=1 Tax=Desulfoprunum benzoelyticum TaxID=1506996 RepID=A0A840UZN3_9BACT|nr:cyclic nucleotide-binding domain-containing protein [Desulfoprunum benzoelyticum]MBB5347010.1 CRP-like cAMP-binding protein [Desulfoprunum benzoelyticum]MBM9531622.1 cyclic nucleotide-binding domain-containing protein [Desulfoprunum benzoelyticum]
MPETSASSASLSAEDKRRLVGRLVTEIETALKARDFLRADILRNQLMDADPMALSEIIKINGLIEEAKTAAFDRDHLAIWNKLYDNLSEEERNGLFYSMKKMVVPPKKLLFSHGTRSDRIFLIERGQVTIFFPKDGQNIILAQMGRGDILGGCTFTTISLCPVSAVTHTEVHLMCLEGGATRELDDKFPGLFDKLIDFCTASGRVDEIVRNKKMEKREFVRYLAEGVVAATVLTAEGQKTDAAFRGDLTNISMAGACFAARISKKATARALLARHLHLSFACGVNDNPTTFKVVGRVVRVSSHLYDDYSIHVRFTRQLPEELIGKIAPGEV